MSSAVRRQQHHLHLVVARPRSMLKCKLASKLNSPHSKSKSGSTASDPQSATSPPSPTLCSLIDDMQRLERHNPRLLKAVARYIALQVDGVADEGGTPIETVDESTQATPAWGWRGHRS
jgi:hypothetical protein